MRHKHADLIHAWAEGSQIQGRIIDDAKWVDLDATRLTWSENIEYRIKPEKKPDLISTIFIDSSGFPWIDRKPGNLRITVDGETGKLIKAEVL